MNILHLEASSGWGGQEIRILREAEGMRGLGHTVILGVEEGGKLIVEACKAGFTVYPLRFRKAYWLITFFQILFLFRRHKVDLVNTHSSLDAWLGGFCARMAGRSIVRTRHLSTPIKGGRNSRILYGKLADFVVTTCASIVPTLCAQSGKSKNLCRSIPTGVDPHRIVYKGAEASQLRDAWGIKREDFLIGTACVMRSWKGVKDLLRAADLLRGEAGIKWVIIGGGHEKEYRQLAKDLGLGGIVHFTGHLDPPFTAIGALDAFTLLSTANEGVSQAILQAAFLEKPLIATATGGLGEVCIDRVTGLLVDPFSPDQVARAALALRRDPALCKEFGHRGRALVEESFTLCRTIDQMETVYKLTTSERRG